MRVALALILTASTVYADAPCPPPAEDGFKGWPPGSTIYYDLEPNNERPEVNQQLMDAFKFAAEAWGQVNARSGYNVTYRRFSGGQQAPGDLSILLRVHRGTLGSVGRFVPIRTPNGERPMIPPPAILNLDLNSFDTTRTDFNTGLRKAIGHELGHSNGLGDMFPETGAVSGKTIMNQQAGKNDSGNHEPNKPTDLCDGAMAAAVNGIGTPPSGNGTGTPQRQRPSQMPIDPCRPCMISQGPERPRVPGFCCAGSGPNGDGPLFPDSPDDFSTMSLMKTIFLQTNYHCSMDGWLRFACPAAMCCVHPDDVLPGGGGVLPIPQGTNCAAQGWWNADGKTACELSIGNQAACVKKEICGPGPCEPWPNYCWKPPFVPNGGGGGDDGGGGDEETGVSCSSKNWYNGDDLSTCEHDHGTCVRKQDCDGQRCLPAPYYCWKPE